MFGLNDSAIAQDTSHIEKINNLSDKAFIMFNKNAHGNGVFTHEFTGAKLGDNNWDHVFIIPPKTNVKADHCTVPWYNGGHHKRIIIEVPWNAEVQKASKELGREGQPEQIKFNDPAVYGYLSQQYLSDPKNNGLKMWQAKHGNKDAIRFRNPGTDKSLGDVGFGAGRHSWTLIIEDGAPGIVKYSLQLDNTNTTLDDITAAVGEIATDVWEHAKTMHVEGMKAIVSAVASK